MGAEDASADEEEAAAEETAEPAVEQGAEEAAANGEGAAAEAEAEEAKDASADPAAEGAAAEQAPEPFPETALPHISDFYTTSTEGNKGRTWDIHAWQAMVKSNCPDLHLLPTEGDMTWSRGGASYGGKFLANRVHI